MRVRGTIRLADNLKCSAKLSDPGQDRPALDAASPKALTPADRERKRCDAKESPVRTAYRVIEVLADHGQCVHEKH